MALNLTYPLKKGTYKRVRGFASHVRSHPGTWYGIDEACKTGTPLIASESGRISHSVKQRTGGGWNFRLNFTKYKGWFMWYAHNSVIPANGKVVKRGQVIGKSGATGGVSGPHLHFSLIQGSTPRDPDNPNVVKWMEVKPMAEPWYTRNIKAKTIEIANLKKAVKSKSVTISQQSAKLKTLAKQIKNLQKDLKEANVSIDRSLMETGELEEKVETLTEKLKVCQETSKNATDTKKGGGNGMLEGKKTYIVAAVLILSAIGQYLTGDITLSAAVTLVLASLGLGALRRGIENK